MDYSAEYYSNLIEAAEMRSEVIRIRIELIFTVELQNVKLFPPAKFALERYLPLKYDQGSLIIST